MLGHFEAVDDGQLEVIYDTCAQLVGGQLKVMFVVCSFVSCWCRWMDDSMNLFEWCVASPVGWCREWWQLSLWWWCWWCWWCWQWQWQEWPEQWQRQCRKRRRSCSRSEVIIQRGCCPCPGRWQRAEQKQWPNAAKLPLENAIDVLNAFLFQHCYGKDVDVEVDVVGCLKIVQIDVRKEMKIWSSAL